MTSEPQRSASERRIVVPHGDHPVVTEHMAKRVLQIVTAALADADTVVDIHGDMAPISAAHVQHYLAKVASDTLGWIERWPR